MNRTVNLPPVPAQSYDIIIEPSVWETLTTDAAQTNAHRHLIVTDENLARFGHLTRIMSALMDAGIPSDTVFTKVIPPGEESKSDQQTIALWNWAAETGASRDTVWWALGGGVIGDLTGFVASTWTRGSPVYQIPTSINAQVDAAVGGKTGITTHYAKNQVGTFWHPNRVYCSADTIKTLPDVEFKSGLAEVIKYGIIMDAEMFNFLEQHRDKVLSRDPETIAYIVDRSVGYKAEVVSEDPNEKGRRRILNGGHTLGHAIEKLSGWRHGESVAAGLAYMAKIAVHKTGFPEEDVGRIESLITAYGLPTRAPIDMDHEKAIRLTASDKKAKGGMPNYCLPIRLGEMHPFDGQYRTPVELELVRRILAE